MFRSSLQYFADLIEVSPSTSLSLNLRHLRHFHHKLRLLSQFWFLILQLRYDSIQQLFISEGVFEFMFYFLLFGLLYWLLNRLSLRLLYILLLLLDLLLLVLYFLSLF